MPKKTAGILLYKKGVSLEFFLVHPGGPYWKNKDQGAWSIPKGEFEDEEPLVAALREFEEETGQSLSGNFLPLQNVKMKSGKTVFAFALEKDIEPSSINSNLFEMEWPPRSGQMKSFPEIDRGDWFDFKTASEKINASLLPLIEELKSLFENQKI